MRPATTRARIDIPVRAQSQTQWVCTAIGEARCGATSGIATIAETVTLPSGSSVRFDLHYNTDPCWRVTTEWVDTVSATALDATDPTPARRSPHQGCDRLSRAEHGDGQRRPASGRRRDSDRRAGGGTTTYTVTATSQLAVLKPFTVTAPLPASLGAARWTCTAEGGARCGAATGTGGLRDVATLAPNPGRLVYKLTATAAATVTAAIRIPLIAGATYQEVGTPLSQWNAADVNRVLAAVDCSPARASVPTLWPPSHALVPVSVAGLRVPAKITSIRQDEPLQVKGAGSTIADGVLQADGTATLRECSGTGDGRVYHLGFLATDPSGRRVRHGEGLCAQGRRAGLHPRPAD